MEFHSPPTTTRLTATGLLPTNDASGMRILLYEQWLAIDGSPEGEVQAEDDLHQES